MASKLFARRKQPKKATILVSKQTIEQAIQGAHGLVEQIINSNAHDSRLDQLQETIGFLENIMNKSPLDMQQEGASTLDDYLDDAIMPEMAQKIKQDVDMIANMKNAGNEAPVQEPVMASGSDNWVSDRDEKGESKVPELAEVPRLASTKKAGDVVPINAPKAPPVSKPSADITQLSSDTLAKMQKALAGSEDLMNDKAAQAFIAAIAEELMNRPVEQEEAPAPAAAPAAAPLPMAASFAGLTLAGSDDDGEEEEEKTASSDWSTTITAMQKDSNIENPTALSKWMQHKGYTAHKGSLLIKQIGGKQLVAAMNRDLQAKVATSQGGAWFVTDKDTGTIKEDGGRTPEIAEAHSKLEDNTGIDRPATELPSKFAAGDMTTGKALKTVEKLGEELKSLYLEAKPVTGVLDSRPVREAIEAIYRAYDLMGAAAKVINKQHIQEQAEEQALEIKEKSKSKKKSSVLFGLALAADEDEDEEETDDK